MKALVTCPCGVRYYKKHAVQRYHSVPCANRLKVRAPGNADRMISALRERRETRITGRLRDFGMLSQREQAIARAIYRLGYQDGYNKGYYPVRKAS